MHECGTWTLTAGNLFCPSHATTRVIRVYPPLAPCMQIVSLWSNAVAALITLAAHKAK